MTLIDVTEIKAPWDIRKSPFEEEMPPNSFMTSKTFC